MSVNVYDPNQFSLNGIGDAYKALPLPHHPACGSAPGGSKS